MIKTHSEVTGRKESCTVFPGLVGADGKRRFAIADVDLLCMVESCLNCRMDNDGMPIITLNVDENNNIVPHDEEFDFEAWHNRTRRVRTQNSKNQMKRMEKMTRGERIAEYARRVEETGHIWEDDDETEI